MFQRSDGLEQSIACEEMSINYPDDELNFCLPQYSPTGRQIAYAIGKIIGFYDPMNKCSMREHLTANCKEVWKLKYSPDGKMLAASGPTYQKSNRSLWYTYTISLFDMINFKMLRILEATAQAFTLEFSQDGSKLISSYKHRMIRIWNTKQGTYQEIDLGIQICRQSETRKFYQFDSVKYLHDDRYFLSSHEKSRIQIWNGRKTIKQFKEKSHLYHVQIDGQKIMSYSKIYNQICYWNARIGSYKIFNLRTRDQSFMITAYSPNSKLIIIVNSDDPIFRICGGNTKKLIKSFRSPFGLSIYHVQFSPDGKFYLEYNQVGFTIKPLFQ